MVIEIKGMHCKSCAKTIEESLLLLKGVEKANASFADESAEVEFDAELISLAQIEGEINRLGYRPLGSRPFSSPSIPTQGNAETMPAQGNAGTNASQGQGFVGGNQAKNAVVSPSNALPGHFLRREILDLEGVECPTCEQVVHDGLSSLDGVEKAVVDYKDETAEIIFDEEIVSLEEIEEEIERLGYGARKQGLEEAAPKETAPEAKPVPAMALAREFRQPAEAKQEFKQTKPAARPQLKAEAKLAREFRQPAEAKPKSSSLKQGIIYGLIPHIGCIGFVVASILGVTFAVELFKPLLMNPWFFYILIAVSLGFATISAMFYLSRNGILSMKGIVRKKKYIGTMYASTVAINLLFFLVIFPLTANFALAAPTNNATGAFALAGTGDSGLSQITLAVQIPCSGHAPLISGELKTLPGINSVTFSLPNLFDITYDPAKTTKQEILGLEIFKTYAATVTKESIAQPKANLQAAASGSTGGGCGIKPSASASGSSCGAGTSAGASGTASAGTVASFAGVGETDYYPGTGTAPGYQTINMDVLAGKYSPNVFVLKAGVPVKWVINGKEVTGCNSTIIVPAYSLNFRVAQGTQTINFTPEKAGTIDWSCGMGMVRGQFIVLDDVSVDSTGKVVVNPDLQTQIASAPPKSGGSCGGGCGGCGG